ncbi:hypothetical protein F5883DRAFT_377966, partial [Diaporthe sp. PMI_573]
QDQLQPHRIRAIESMLDEIDQVFNEEKIASERSDWCNEVPRELKIETIQSFLTAMHDKSTLPTKTCAICLVQTPARDMRSFSWQIEMSQPLKANLSDKTKCRKCFPTDQSNNNADICSRCYDDVRLGQMPVNCGGDLRFISCSHLYPPALSGLAIAEERLIGLNCPYGYITRYCRPTNTGTSWHFRQHKKGHITVYVNDLESLIATVLPHPLIKVMESIRVCWSGGQVPSATDLSKLMSVRRDKILQALRWKKAHDELYAHIHIDEQVMATWDIDPESSVPNIVWSHMEHLDDSI